MNLRRAIALAGLLVVLAGAAHADEACEPRAAEQDGVRFVSVCPAGFWIAAAPVSCAGAAPQGAACDPVIALEWSALPGASKNRHVDALVGAAVLAKRVCAERFAGRLPTVAEREQARLALALATLRVREEPSEFPRLLPHAQREWVTEAGTALRYPSVETPPLAGGDALLRCAAEPNPLASEWVPIGASCAERPDEAGVRSPACAVAVPGTSARFEIGCDPAWIVRSRAQPEHAAFRCVLPEGALGAVRP